MSAATTHGNFDLVKAVKLDHQDIELQKWRSRETGLTIVHLNYESTLVSGYFVVRTEIFDDSGCPHTLEHLCFMGSNKYPHKGVLDKLATRAFSNGTNAWTDTDNTTYTMDTAGKEGFLRLLPVFVDHILYPTITDSGFVTEVHHINGEGQDAGVVYAEMQGREQTSGDLGALKMRRTLYPEGSAYRSETGGLMEALRVLSAEKIRDYHKTYYVPHNLCMVVAGSLPTEELLNVLQTEVEPNILQHGQNGPPPDWKRPFLSTPSAIKPVISELTFKTVEFPEKDESVGDVSMYFVGPPNSDVMAHKALSILEWYLTDSPVSPLQKDFVEIAAPYCTYISMGSEICATFTVQAIYFGAVPIKEQEGLYAKVMDSLKRIASEGFDLERIKLVLKRHRRSYLSGLESSGGDVFTSSVLNDFLYGEEDGSTIEPFMLGEFQRYAELAAWTSDQWVACLKQYIDNPPVIILSKPSAALPEKLEKEEKERVAAQKEALGEAGLAEKVKLLEEAKAKHEQPVPQEILTAFKVPHVSSISWIPLQSAWNEPPQNTNPPNELQKKVSADGDELPFYLQFEHAKGSFVHVIAFFSTEEVPTHFLPYLSIYTSAFFSLPVTRADGTKLTHEEMIKQLNGVSLNLGASTGPVENYVGFSLQVEVEDYAEGIAWLKDLIFGSEFTKERLEVLVAQDLQSLPDQKRDGNTVLWDTYSEITYDKTSLTGAYTLNSRTEFLNKMQQRLKDEPETVIAEFNQIREALTRPEGAKFAVYGNVLNIPSLRKPWAIFNDKITKAPLHTIEFPLKCLTPLGNNPAKKAIVVTVPSTESCYGVHAAKGPVGYKHPDLAALRVACEVLDGSESFFWRSIRGAGLAYGANMGYNLEAGLVTFSVYKAPDSFKAFEEAKKVVEGIVDGSIPLEDVMLDGAKSSLVYSTASGVSYPVGAAWVALINQAFRGTPGDNGRRQLEAVYNVSIDMVRETMKKYILPVFNPESSIAVVASSPAKTQETVDQLTKAGYDVETRTIEVAQTTTTTEVKPEVKSS